MTEKQISFSKNEENLEDSQIKGDSSEREEIKELIHQNREQLKEIDRLNERIAFFEEKYSEIITKTHRVSHIENKYPSSTTVNPKHLREAYDRLHFAHSESLKEKSRIIESLNREFITNETLRKNLEIMRNTVESTIDKTDIRNSIADIKYSLNQINSELPRHN